MLKRSWKLMTLAGIPVKIHVSYLLIVVLVIGSSVSEGPAMVAFGLALLALAYACVVLHELGHCLVARRCGIRTRAIYLLAIGGLALLEQAPGQNKSPRQAALDELAIALAGPAVNVVIAGLLAIGMSLFGLWYLDFLLALFVFNIIMLVFNLIPAFPMDGGRVLRALLTLRLGRFAATRLAVKIGRGIAVFMGVGGLILLNPVLVLIAVFVWIAGAMEARGVRPRPSIVPEPVTLLDPEHGFRKTYPLQTVRLGTSTIRIAAE